MNVLTDCPCSQKSALSDLEAKLLAEINALKANIRVCLLSRLLSFIPLPCLEFFVVRYWKRAWMAFAVN